MDLKEFKKIKDIVLKHTPDNTYTKTMEIHEVHMLLEDILEDIVETLGE